MAYICKTCRREVLHSINHVCWAADPNKPIEMLPTDAKLAASLALDNLTSVAKTIGRVKRAFDSDEDAGGSFRIEHGGLCPSPPKVVPGTHHCSCGLAQTLEELRDACAVLESVMAQIGRLK